MTGVIRPLALCVFRRDDGAILVARGYDKIKDQRFYRPLGGTIEFGELAEEAAQREIREELGAETDGLRLLGVFENRFVLNGDPGHELIWMFEGRFLDPSFYARDHMLGEEGEFTFPVEWVPLSVFTSGEAPLYPDGFLGVLTKIDTPSIMIKTMDSTFGYDAGDWNEAIDQARRILIEFAKSRQLISYSDLTARITAIKLDPHSPVLAGLLGQISATEDSGGRGMLTVLVVHKSGVQKPGPGFFELARTLGKDASDEDSLFIEEFKKVTTYWSGPHS